MVHPPQLEEELNPLATKPLRLVYDVEVLLPTFIGVRVGRNVVVMLEALVWDIVAIKQTGQ